MTVRLFLPFVLSLMLSAASSAAAQSWGQVDAEGNGAGAYVCPIDDAETGNFLCFRLECSATAPLSFDLSYAGGAAAPEELPVELSVDGDIVGRLVFTPVAAQDYTRFTAPFDARLHPALVDQLRRGNRARLALGFSDGVQDFAVSLRGSDKSLGAVMAACPLPDIPMGDPASAVLDKIVAACTRMDGSVAMEPGFRRYEDLDGDGRDDLVINYASAVCSQMASLYCGSGGCNVGMFLARDEGFTELFTGVIRDYAAKPGGRLALDLHGSACGLYGFEACRRVFDITGGGMELVEEFAGAAAEAAMAADDALESAAPAPLEAEQAPEAPGGLGKGGKGALNGN